MRSPIGGSKLFHAVVVMGLSVASSACGSAARPESGTDGGGKAPDGSSDDGTTDGSTSTGEAGVASEDAPVLGVRDASPTDAVDPGDAASGGGDAARSSGTGDGGCTELCCPPIGPPVVLPCGAPMCWPCYV